MDTDWTNLMIFSIIISNNYENWKDNNEITSLVDINKNQICISLKKNYPFVEDKVIQSIALGFLVNMYNTIKNYKTTLSNNDFEFQILEVD